MTYDFKPLNDKEFERLVVDLLSRELATRVERFRPGKDKDVDGRFFISAKREAVIQCKHWPRSNVSALVKYMADTEKPKIDRLKPARYLLATSLELSRENKNAIVAAVAPWIRTPSDVLGNEDLNDLIAKYPEVERRHFKLWLSSAEVLKTILHAAIRGRSSFTLDELKAESARYVQTDNHFAAKAKLEKMHTVLITGEPGIGKTTLAGQLCLEYVVEHGFQLCVLADSIEEAEGIFEPGTKQVFYFDDFLGRNYLDALDRHEDSHIVNFIRRIIRDGSKRFVLTSRTTILNQGKHLSELFRINNVERSEYEIRVASLTALDKAQILYNHIWFSDLKHSYIEQILSEKRYRAVIAHKNFNPRLISFITDAQKLVDIVPTKYWAYIAETLTNPADVWDHVYHNQLNDYARALLLLAVYNGGTISEPALKSAYEKFLRLPASRRYAGRSDFTAAMSALVGAVLNRVLEKERPAQYTLFNPSVADYVLRRTAGERNLLSAIFQALFTEESLLNLQSLIVSKVVSKSDGARILSAVAKSNLPVALSEEKVDYGALLADLTLTLGDAEGSTKNAVTKYVKRVEIGEAPISRWSSLAAVADLCLTQGQITPERAVSLVRKCSSSASNLDHDDLLALSKMRQHLEGDVGEEVAALLRPLIVGYWEDTIESDIRKNGTLSEFYSEDDIPTAEDRVTDTVYDILEAYGLAFEASDVNAIASQVDVAHEIERNQEESAGDYESSGGGVQSWNGPDAVDDLFDTDGPMGGKG